jgi:hypothetical protein
MVTGPYDVIVRVRLADLHDLDVLLSARVRPLTECSASLLPRLCRAEGCPVMPRMRVGHTSSKARSVEVPAREAFQDGD